MALTPEDVVNKRFQPTKFREGYDQDEVDDFLDEIVVELRRLTQENDDLRKKLADSAANPQAQNAGGAAAAAEPAEKKEAAKPAAPEAKKDKAVPAEKTETTPQVSAAAPAAGSGSSESAAGVLAMAQRLHDEYVNAGVEQRDKIIAEAQVEAHGLVNEAQEKSRKTLGDLEQKRSVLERKVEQLRGFERDYRSRLKAYIEGQLRDLDSRGSVASADAAETSNV